MFESAKCVHLIGAGGIGVSAVGKWLMAQGCVVTGSDAASSAITDDLVRRGIAITIGHDAKNIPAECNLVVYTEAASEDNVERVEATARGIRILGHFGFLGELSANMRTICVTGTNGKSTTTAMLGKIFEDAGLDPTVFVGSLVPGWELGNLRIGASDILIIEGDEYKRKMLSLSPETTVITNVELDHTDVYKDLDDVVATFQQLVDKTSGDVFVNADDANSQRLQGDRVSSYAHSDVTGSIGVPGIFNRANAAAARIVAKQYGIADGVIAQSLASFTGIWRRFERVGDIDFPPVRGGIKGGAGIPVISDYAHHPTAVKATLLAAKEFFPGKRIILAFQPHQHNRTRELFDDFVTAFDAADVVVLAEIYGVKGRTDTADISSSDLVDAIKQHNSSLNISYAASLDDVEKQLREEIKDGDVVLVMGAGDIDSVARRLVL